MADRIINPILTAIIIISAIFTMPPILFGGSESSSGPGSPVFIHNRLTPEALAVILEGSAKKDFIMIDVRESDENESVRIPGSINVPLQKIEEWARQMDKTKPLILYCKTGPRSERAAEILGKLGFEEVYILEGGMMAWIDIRGQVETPRILPWIEGKGCES